MSLLFFISGLFLYNSIEKKGALRFTGKRLIRLGIPLLIGVFITNIPGFYFERAYYFGAAAPGYMEFWLDNIRNITARNMWSLWFLELLIIFSIIAIILYKVFPSLGKIIRTKGAYLFNHTWLFVLILFVLSSLAYIPMLFKFGEEWLLFGPFMFQLNRILHYFVYFIMGILTGIYGLNRGVLEPDRPIAKYWYIWLVSGIIGYVIFCSLTDTTKSIIIDGVFFTFICMTVSIGLLGFFTRYVKNNNKVFDNLSSNSYGIYIVHMPILVTLHFLLLNIDFFSVFKPWVVVIAGLLLSWGLTAALRLIPVVRKVI
jgi:surface polysaccharide O-acyltransferase-like enzyme